MSMRLLDLPPFRLVNDERAHRKPGLDVPWDDPRVLVVVATARTEGVVADEVTDGDAAVER